MYYQVFYRRNLNSRRCQISCDSWPEVQEEIERLGRPKLVEVQYYDERGHFGTGFKFYHTVKEVYETYRKVKLV